MKNLIIYLPLVVVFMLLSSCKKDKVNAKEELPAATMEGKNTFGAMVNGKVWLPKGRPSFFESNFKIIYEPGYEGGSLSVVAYRVNPAEFEYFIIGRTQVNDEGVYTWDNPELGSASFYNESCEYDRSPGVYRKGSLEITKLDLQNGIIAGKFEFTLARPGCDTIRVTEGRFDKKMF